MAAPIVLIASRTDIVTPTPIALAPGQMLDFENIKAARMLLTVSALGVAVTDTFDLYIQHSIDGGTTYDDFIHFTQVLGNGGAVKKQAQWVRDVTPTTAMRAPGTASLSAGVSQGPVGATWRADAHVGTSAGTPSFTWKLEADLLRDRY